MASFGLGRADYVETLIITWPSGCVDVYDNVSMNLRLYATECQGVTAAPENAVVATIPRLLPNAPNPFNPVTSIRFELPQPGPVTLNIYDTAGRLIRRLSEDQWFDAGRHDVTWDARDGEGRIVSSGVYFSRLKVGEHVVSGRLTLVK